MDKNSFIAGIVWEELVVHRVKQDGENLSFIYVNSKLTDEDRKEICKIISLECPFNIKWKINKGDFSETIFYAEQGE
jgi:hypothetical protein